MFQAIMAAVAAIPKIVDLLQGLGADFKAYAQAQQDQRIRDYEAKLDALTVRIGAIKNAQDAQALANELAALQRPGK